MTSKYFFVCNVIPEQGILSAGANIMDIIIMPAATKSSHTRVSLYLHYIINFHYLYYNIYTYINNKAKGGSSTDPMNSFIGEQLQRCKMGQELHVCYSHLLFSGNSNQRQQAISALTRIACAGLEDDAELSSPSNCNGTNIIAR